MSASLIGRLGSSTFRLSTTALSMPLTGSRFSSESAPRPFHYGIRGRGGTVFGSLVANHCGLKFSFVSFAPIDETNRNQETGVALSNAALFMISNYASRRDKYLRRF